jgi:pimeloyl-ACP methyl ester carboxylesterase
VVVGHSLGGAVALTAGVRRPELVRALVLEDPGPLGPDDSQANPVRGDIKPSTPWTVLFAEVSVPVLVVSGDPDGDVCVTEGMEQGIARLGNPSVTLTTVKGAGHCIRREQPEQFYAVVDEWLSRH